MRERLRPGALVRRVLLAPTLLGGAGLCALLVLALTGSPSAKSVGPAEHSDDEASLDFVMTLRRDIEGTPTTADIARARVPVTRLKRRLRAHPYFALYKAAKSRYGVPWFLLASMHYQETGFKGARKRVRRADYAKVMQITAALRGKGARDLGTSAMRAAVARYGSDAGGRLSSAMVIERARAWKLLGQIPLPGSGELATPVNGTVGGCGYFHCPRPGHLHNGVDFLAPSGSPIHAADAGRIAIIQTPGASGGYGNFVCVQHRPHLASCYAHMSAFAPNLKVGHRVKRGEVLGRVGSTGSSSAPHLHFEVRRGAASCQTCAVDPMSLLDGKVPQDSVPELLKLPRAARRAPSARASVYVAPPVAPAAPVPAAPDPEPEPDELQPAPEPKSPAPPPAPAPATVPAAPPPAATDAGGVAAP